MIAVSPTLYPSSASTTPSTNATTTFSSPKRHRPPPIATTLPPPSAVPTPPSSSLDKFEVEHDLHVTYVFKSLNIKWREHRQELWQQKDDGTHNIDQLIAMVPEGLNKDQWASFVDYLLDSKTKELECGHKVSRGEIWIATHKHANKEFVNEKTKEIGVEDLSQVDPYSTPLQDVVSQITLRLPSLRLSPVPLDYSTLLYLTAKEHQLINHLQLCPSMPHQHTIPLSLWLGPESSIRISLDRVCPRLSPANNNKLKGKKIYRGPMPAPSKMCIKSFPDMTHSRV
ncbi:hypothetical protein Fmac_005843 [Flemingia macrophylla]|uniref:Uncharacterized protein n=1 Tax=Flemingia macrophylla TaxID=520843 RepID=A0ABD1N9D4_9FABA